MKKEKKNSRDLIIVELNLEQRRIRKKAFSEVVKTLRRLHFNEQITIIHKD